MKKIIFFLSVFSIAFVLSVSFFAPRDSESPGAILSSTESQTHSEVSLTETKLATIPESFYGVRHVVFSSNGKQAAYKARRGAEEFAVIGDQAGKGYEGILDSILLTSDGRKFAYHGRRGGKGFLVIDGNNERPYQDAGIDAKPRGISPDGRLLAAQVKEQGKWHIVLFDWEREVFRSQGYEWSYRSPIFSPDGRFLVYELGDKRGRTDFIIADLKTGKIQRKQIGDVSTSDIVFTPDSSRLAYKAITNGKHSIFLRDFASKGEREVAPPYDSIEWFRLAPSGRRFAYRARRAGQDFMVISNWDTPSKREESKGFEVIVDQPVFSPGESTIVFIAAEEKKYFAVVNEKEGPDYERIIPSPVFSPDGAKIAYAAMKNGKWVMVVSAADDPATVQEGPAFDMVISPVFSPDGSKLVYRARRGPMTAAERFIVIADRDGRVLKEGPVCDEVWEPGIDEHGKAVFYGARIGRELWWKVQALP